MTDKETEAHNLVRHKEWTTAVQIYDQILSPTTTNFKTPKERIIGCLVGRTECYMELKNYEMCINDCRRVLKMFNEMDVCSTSARIRRRLIHALYKLKRFQDAETACREWINSICGPQNNSDMSKVLERYRTVIQIANGQKSNQRISIQRLDEEMTTLDCKLETWASHNLPQDRFSRITKQLPINSNVSSSSNKKLTNHEAKSTTSNNIIGKDTPPTNNKIENQFQRQIEQIATLNLNNGGGAVAATAAAAVDVSSSSSSSLIEPSNGISCTYCSLSFSDRSELRFHCQTDGHQNVIMSDEGESIKTCNYSTINN